MIKKLSKAERQQGFTLVELLVAIAIIAILAVIGLTVFTGLQRGARDATRRSDVQAITKALEANYNTTNAQYVTLQPSNFAGGVIPRDPLNNALQCNSSRICEYCIASITTGGVNPSDTTQGAGDGCGSGAPGGAVQVDGTQPPAGTTGYLVCTNLEGAPGSSTTHYCQGSQR